MSWSIWMLMPGFNTRPGWSMISTDLTQEDAERFAKTFLFPVQAMQTTQQPSEENEES